MTGKREIYEKAIERMDKFGSKALGADHLINGREDIKDTMLQYYESTEEFEKCAFIKEYFQKLEKEISISSVVDSLKNK